MCPWIFLVKQFKYRRSKLAERVISSFYDCNFNSSKFVLTKTVKFACMVPNIIKKNWKEKFVNNKKKKRTNWYKLALSQSIHHSPGTFSHATLLNDKTGHTKNAMFLSLQSFSDLSCIPSMELVMWDIFYLQNKFMLIKNIYVNKILI